MINIQNLPEDNVRWTDIWYELYKSWKISPNFRTVKCRDKTYHTYRIFNINMLVFVIFQYLFLLLFRFFLTQLLLNATLTPAKAFHIRIMTGWQWSRTINAKRDWGNGSLISRKSTW